MPTTPKPPYPPPLYTFSVKAAEDFTAQLTLSANCTLSDLAEIAIKAIGFDFDHSFGFYNDLKNAYDSTEKYTIFADIGEDADEDDTGVESTYIGDVFEPGRTMNLLFDYGDDWQFPVYCESVLPGKNSRKVRKIINRSGSPPVQYDYPDEDVLPGEDES